jgi:hypothetical protein
LASPGADGGGADAGVEAAAPYCASHAGQFDFCSDFDERPLPESWDAPSTVGAVSVTEDNGDSTSPPTSALMETPSLGPAQGDGGVPPKATAGLVKGALPHGLAHIDFDVRIVETSFPDPNDKTAVISLLALSLGKDYLLTLSLRPAPGGPFALVLYEIPSLTDPSSAHANPIRALPQVAGWSHVHLELQTGATAGTIAVQIDGSNPQTFQINPGALAIAGERTMAVGSLAQGACGPAKVRFDNVTWSH